MWIARTVKDSDVRKTQGVECKDFRSCCYMSYSDGTQGFSLGPIMLLTLVNVLFT